VEQKNNRKLINSYLANIRILMGEIWMRTILNKVVARLAEYGTFNWMEDEQYLKLIYWARMGKRLNLDNPVTFNEKLQWLKLHERKPIYSKMVDKYEAKEYVASIIGEEYIIPTLGIWDRFEDIDFDKLPNQFVLKCTHDSGGLVICKDKSKLDIEAAKAKIKKSLGTNYYLRGREWPYKNVKPRIIAETYMEDLKTEELKDYKFFCFGGKVQCIAIHFDRFTDHRCNYYDTNSKIMPFGSADCPPNFKKNINIPSNMDEMIILAERLANDMLFLRVDFYNVGGKIFFGEATFYPGAGYMKFMPDEWDSKLGSWLELPNR
jgi:hypothetical protein